VREAALNLVDDFLDHGFPFEVVMESASNYFEDGWTNPEELDAGEDAGAENVTLNSEDYTRVQEEADSLLRFLRDRTDLYYD
jgi:hypothetical protein